jgi:hypothetical protein
MKKLIVLLTCVLWVGCAHHKFGVHQKNINKAQEFCKNNNGIRSLEFKVSKDLVFWNVKCSDWMQTGWEEFNYSIIQ